MLIWSAYALCVHIDAKTINRGSHLKHCKPPGLRRDAIMMQNAKAELYKRIYNSLYTYICTCYMSKWYTVSWIINNVLLTHTIVNNRLHKISIRLLTSPKELLSNNKHSQMFVLLSFQSFTKYHRLTYKPNIRWWKNLITKISSNMKTGIFAFESRRRFVAIRKRIGVFLPILTDSQ